MGLIEVNGIRVFAYHGCLAEEGRIGGHYQVDVRVEGDLAPSRDQRPLGHTVDYGRVTAIVKEQMAQRSNLIEHVARRILDALKRGMGPGLTLARAPGEGTSARQGDVDQAVYRWRDKCPIRGYLRSLPIFAGPLDGRVAEWLGTALQKLLLRFESARDLDRRKPRSSGAFALYVAGNGRACSLRDRHENAPRS